MGYVDDMVNKMESDRTKALEIGRFDDAATIFLKRVILAQDRMELGKIKIKENNFYSGHPGCVGIRFIQRTKKFYEYLPTGWTDLGVEKVYVPEELIKGIKNDIQSYMLSKIKPKTGLDTETYSKQKIVSDPFELLGTLKAARIGVKTGKPEKSNVNDMMKTLTGKENYKKLVSLFRKWNKKGILPEAVSEDYVDNGAKMTYRQLYKLWISENTPHYIQFYENIVRRGERIIQLNKKKKSTNETSSFAISYFTSSNQRNTYTSRIHPNCTCSTTGNTEKSSCLL